MENKDYNFKVGVALFSKALNKGEIVRAYFEGTQEEVDKLFDLVGGISKNPPHLLYGKVNALNKPSSPSFHVLYREDLTKSSGVPDDSSKITYEEMEVLLGVIDKL